jgi:hypothetical protein
MSQIYQYIEQLNIKSNRDAIINHYLDKELRKQWQKNLIDVIPVGFDELEIGRTYALHYQQHGHHMEMKETILDLDLPNFFDVLYEVTGVKNRCKNQLIEKNGYVLWIMEVEFEFENEVFHPINQFKSKTRESMETLKHYLENLK